MCKQSTRQPLRMRDFKLNKCSDLPAAEMSIGCFKNIDDDAEDDAL